MSEAAVSAHDIPTRFWRDRRGAVAIAVAVLLPVLVGFAGIGVEVGLWFAVQRQNQSAADAAAISAALEYAGRIQTGVTTTDPTAAAITTANYNLFSTNSPNTLTLYPCYGFTVGSSCNTLTSNGALNAVQVALTQPLNTALANFVTAIWGPNVNPVNVTTTAIAAFPMLPGGQTCLLGVGGGNPPTGNILLATGSATLNLPNCSFASLSTSGNSIQVSSSASLTINAAAIATAGNIQIDSGGNAKFPPYTFTNSPLQDPYKSVARMPLTGAMPAGPCNPQLPNLNDGQPHTVQPTMLYCGVILTDTANVTFSGGTYYIGSGGIDIQGWVNVTFGPGLYYLDGGNLNITRLTGSVIGAGVTFVLTASNGGSAGGIDIASNACSATISLRGTQMGHGLLQPSATASQGLLFFQDPTAVTSLTPQPNVITTGASNSGCPTSNVTLNGAIYTPASLDSLQGNASANFAGCTEFIAQSFTFSNVQLDDTGCSGITLNQAQIRQVYLAM